MTATIPQLLPKGWKELQLGEVVSKERGAFVNGPFGSDLLTSELVAEGVPVIYIRDIRDGIYKRVSNVCVTPQKAQDLEVCQVRPGDVLVAKVGDPPGISAIYPNGYPNAVVTQDVIKIRVNPKLILPEYLVYFLNSAKGQKLLHPIIVEGTRSRFGLTPFKEVEILVPPIAEQKRIATIAQKADRLRRTRRYTLELSDSYLRSVFLEMFGDLEKNSKAFPLFPFDDVCAIDAEMVDPKLKQYQNHLHIGGANIESITGNLLDLKTAEEEGLISGKFLINPEHILFSKIRPKLRKVAYPRIHGLCSADIYPIRVCNPECNSHFLLYYLRSEYFSKIVSELAESRTNIPKVNREELSEQSIPLPPFSLQQKFAQIVQRFERLRIQQREAERQAEHLFHTILHRAFRGEL